MTTEAPSAGARVRALFAGAAGALAWAAYEPLGQRVFSTGYGDVQLLEKLLGSARSARIAHVVNGALFGLVYDELRRRLHRDGATFGVAVAVAENALLWPVVGLVDADEAASLRAFASASAGHAVFGAVLGVLA